VRLHRDQAVYRGRQVFLYKRAQIFAGDLYGAYGGRGLGAFDDIHRITMFADYRCEVWGRHTMDWLVLCCCVIHTFPYPVLSPPYFPRVPVVLHVMGILKYSPALKGKVWTDGLWAIC
jgi:hypothetical protein